MDLKSPIFDRIRIRPTCEEPRRAEGQACEFPGCPASGTHRAPKGRRQEGQYWRFCMEHVREYNASYNYFDGMSDAAVQAYQKDSIVGHRPTWSMGANPARHQSPDQNQGQDAERDWPYDDPLGILPGAGVTPRKKADQRPRRRTLSGPVRKALDILGLDDSADSVLIRSTFKTLVKKFHPDAHGGDRSFEERLRDIIKAHDTLRAAGLC